MSGLLSENRQDRSRHIPDRRSGDISRNQVRLPRPRGGKALGRLRLELFRSTRQLDPRNPVDRGSALDNDPSLRQ